MYLGISVCTFPFHTWPRRAAQTGKLRAQVYFLDLMKCDERKRGKREKKIHLFVHFTQGSELSQPAAKRRKSSDFNRL